ncbi:MAG: hypothetical protein ACI93R_002228 [Flavobacteriales bacterium]|jgi:hypothetical protein
MYNELNIEKILKTIARLEARINERIPNSNISKVCGELHITARGVQARIDKLTRPNMWVRGGVIALLCLFFSVLIYTLNILEWTIVKPNLAGIIQLSEALINDVILVGAALFFLITFEQRLKRREVLKELHKLRSIAHVVDLHQLTKDPSMLHYDREPTENSPERNMPEFELQRYLDYCSEMFSMIGKLAALFSERLPEPSIVSAANDIESLCTDLSRKVWQKMVFLGSRSNQEIEKMGIS